LYVRRSQKELQDTILLIPHLENARLTTGHTLLSEILGDAHHAGHTLLGEIHVNAHHDTVNRPPQTSPGDPENVNSNQHGAERQDATSPKIATHRSLHHHHHPGHVFLHTNGKNHVDAVDPGIHYGHVVLQVNVKRRALNHAREKNTFWTTITSIRIGRN
jgi:hypothetical protein